MNDEGMRRMKVRMRGEESLRRSDELKEGRAEDDEKKEFHVFGIKTGQEEKLDD